jgi:hypothetical protein
VATVLSGRAYGLDTWPKSAVVAEAQSVVTKRGEKTTKLVFLDHKRNALDKYAIVAQSDSVPQVGQRYLVDFRSIPKKDGTPSKGAAFVAEVFEEPREVVEDTQIHVPAEAVKTVASQHSQEDNEAYWASILA